MAGWTVAAFPAAWQPDRDEARRLLDEELSQELYDAAQPNPVGEWLRQRLTELLDWLDSLGTGAAPVPGWALVLLLVAAAVVVLLLVRPRTNARRRRQDATVLTDRTLSPDDHRRAAHQALSRGDHAGAVVGWFRAAVRQAEVRTVLDGRPGRTATEAARALAAVVPHERSALHGAAGLFNAVLYDHAPATAEQARAVRDVDRRLAGAPTPTPGPAASPDPLEAPR